MKITPNSLIFFIGYLSNYVATAATLNLGIGISSLGLVSLTGVPLTSGLANVDGDGAILQIGYYTLATPLSPFAGQWVPITGPDTPYPTTIGDSGYPDGLTKSTNFLIAGTFGFVEPAVGTPLALRFYNSTSLASSTYFNAVAATDGSFTWVAPSDPLSFAGIDLPNSNIIWQDGAGSAYRTTIAIPEPTFSIFLAFSVGLLATRRRRIKSIS
jgi:hypothetical protein